MEDFVKCSICEKSVFSKDASKMTPHQLAGMKIDRSDIQVGVLISFATTVITFNNPTDSPDEPMWWICKQCQTSRLSVGDYSKNVNQMDKIKQSLNEES